MSRAHIIAKLFVKPFYRENAGTFVFLVTVMFCIVNRVDGAGLFEYHYVLVKGMLTNPLFLAIVFFLWMLYARKCFAFVRKLLNTPEFTFADIFNCFSKTKRFTMFFGIQLLLQLPVLLYTVFINYIAVKEHYYFHAVIITSYLIMLSAITAFIHVRQLDKLSGEIRFLFPRLIPANTFPAGYTVLLLRYIGGKQKLTWAAIKLFTCGILYVYAKNTTFNYQDIPFAFLLFNFGVLANGVLINRVRGYEETYLSFYRSLPVSIGKRLFQYAAIYCMIMLPEIIISLRLAPEHLHYQDAILFIISGYSVVLLLNSLSFLRDFSKKDYFKVIVVIFFVEYALLITAGLVALTIVFLLLSVGIFFKNYYRYEV